MKLPDWFKELRPHFTWYLIAILLSGLGVDAAIASGISWAFKRILASMGAPAEPTHFYFVLGCLIFCGILLSVILAFVLAGFMSKHRVADTPIASPMPGPEELRRQLFPPQLPEPPKPPAPPKPVDLQGLILELHFFRPMSIFGASQTFVLIKVQIVNRGPDEASITHCGLTAQIGGSFQQTGTISPRIPPEWRLKKKREGVLLGEFFDEFAIGPMLGANAHEEIYKKGHPREGWLAFEFPFSMNSQFPNANFDLALQDSLGGEHHIVRVPQVYIEAGEIVIANKPEPPKLT